MAGCPICEDLHHGASSCPYSLAGQSLGNYRVDRFLAAGGMGAVYVGEHQTLGSPVAIKTLHRAFLPQHAKGDERRKLAETLVKRFTDEARRAASLRHPNIVRVEDLGVAPDGTPYLAMEFLEGISLKELLESSGPLDPARAAELVAQALDALEFAHQRNIIHRDIKPENLYLQHPGTRGELVKVLDFGIAKAVGDGATRLGLTQTGHGAMGTFYYMSPEQAADPRKVTASSDVFSVGASLFELLTGKNVLFEIERELTTSGLMAVQFLHGVLSAIMEGNIERHPRKVRGEIPEWLDAIVARSLAHDPGARFASAGEMAEALHAGAAGQPVGATPMALAATAPSRPMMVPRTQVAPSIADAERPSARMAAARASGASLGSTTSESAGEQVTPVSQPRPLQPVRSKMPLVIGALVALAGAGATAAIVAGGGEPDSAGAPTADAGEVAAAVDAAASSFAEVIRLAGAGDCDAAKDAYFAIADTSDVEGRAEAQSALGRCQGAATGASVELSDAQLAELAKQNVESPDKPAEKPAEKPGPAGIRVNTKPPCDVFIDGRRVGTAPTSWVEVTPGRHRIRLVSVEHGIRERLRVTVKPGERKTVVKNFTDRVASKDAPEPPKHRCDEVSCLVAKDPPACCDKFKKKEAPPGPEPDDSLPPKPTRTDITSGVGKVRGRVQACGDRHPFKGTVKVRFKVAPDGSVASVSASPGPEALQRCIELALRKARFRKTQLGITINYPFVFR